jgi:hypothetical protein
MPTLDPAYISSTPLQWYFVDKDTGAPLAGGVVTFYEQDNQTVLKPIFELSDSAPNGFIELPNPIFLTSVGTFSDDNRNDIIPYFYPFDANGNPQLYFVTVYSSGGVLQFTREDWPPNMVEGGNEPSTQNNLLNYAANGQFLLHNNHPIMQTITTIGTDTVSFIAQGGWTFEKDSTSTSTDTVSFIREISASTNPNVDANPRYFFQIATNGTDTNYTRKDLCLNYPDVNKFAGDPTLDSSNYTFSFQGFVSSGGVISVEIILRKIFGDGGSADSEVLLGTIALNTSEDIYNISFTFGENSGDNVGATDSDYLQLCIRFPNSAQTVQLTDFVLTPGVTPVAAFPQTPNFEFIRDSTIGYLPTPEGDGSDLELPVLITDQGSNYDFSRVGQVIQAFYTPAYAANFPLLLCDGSVYISSNYSDLGVPYTRLANMLIANSAIPNTPMFGTGPNYVLTTQSTNTFTVVTQGGSGSATAGTSGFTLVSSPPSFQFTIVTAPAASTYFTFTTVVPNTYAVWYNLNNSPPPTGLGSDILIPVVITSAMTTTDIAIATQLAINSYQFAVPNLIGMFLRGFDSTGAVDPSFNTRTIAALGLTGAFLGGIEAQAFLAHLHSAGTLILPGFQSESVFNTSSSGTALGAGGNTAITGNTGTTGGNETRPINTAINFYIYY